MSTVRVTRSSDNTVEEYRFGGEAEQPSCVEEMRKTLEGIVQVLSNEPSDNKYAGVVMPRPSLR